MKTGLVLEGGAMRGLFTAGVIDVLLENGIKTDGMIGVSAGATFGCNYKSEQTGRTLRYNVKYCRDKRYCSFYSLLKTGDLYGADFCYRKIPFELDAFDVKAFVENPMEFFVVCTDIEKGKPLYYRYMNSDERDLEYMRASASMPLVSRVVEIDGLKLLDGGMTDSIPLEHFQKLGYDRNIVVLTQPKDYTKLKNKLLFAMKLLLRKYPALIEAMADRHNMYNSQKKYVFEEEKKGNVLVIAPPCKLPVGRTEKNPQKLKEAYSIGRKTAQDKLEEIKSFLEYRL